MEPRVLLVLMGHLVLLAKMDIKEKLCCPGVLGVLGGVEIMVEMELTVENTQVLALETQVYQ
jgi:hypothetical protein